MTDSAAWSYTEAFSRNVGLISREEQTKLRETRVAIAGMGGVGGIHLITLARLGIGKFTIADPDSFDVANFNRQAGATVASVGSSKAEVMADLALEINPDLDIRVLKEPVSKANVNDFFSGADAFLDGVDFFSIQARRLLFGTARRLGLWAITAGPIGFSSAWLSFDPNGMTFDQYFDLDDTQSTLDQLAAFTVGLTPRATHLRYIDLEEVDLSSRTGPSVSLACQLASGIAATEIVKVVLGRGKIKPAPHFHQFDSYRLKYRSGRLIGGNRHPLQRLKRAYLRRRFRPFADKAGISSKKP